ncbi:hypothetical protein D3C71_1958540 [compost metagenome]
MIEHLIGQAVDLAFLRILLGNGDNFFHFLRDVRFDIPKALKRLDALRRLHNGALANYRRQAAVSRRAFDREFEPAAAFLTDRRIQRA